MGAEVVHAAESGASALPIKAEADFSRPTTASGEVGSLCHEIRASSEADPADAFPMDMESGGEICRVESVRTIPGSAPVSSSTSADALRQAGHGDHDMESRSARLHQA